MGFPTKIVSDRIEELEPENGKMILGHLLLQMQDQQINNLAESPDLVSQEVISKAKAEVCQLLAPLKLSVLSAISPQDSQYAPFSTESSRPVTLQVPWCHGAPQFAAKNHNTDLSPISYWESTPELPNQSQFLSLEDQVEPVNLGSVGFLHDYLYLDAESSGFGPRRGRKRARRSRSPIKICVYFNKGFCKHGNNCRFFHGHGSERSHLMLDGVNEDQVFSPGSLEKLELEIVELLKSRRGHPISVASLPMIYFEKYGKVLQAEGYLPESQRHGKAGYSLTKLLARLENSIRLIGRPHGQHAVIMAEDAHKYMESWHDRNDQAPIVNGSRQIYLTFQAESPINEDDVSNYFSNFGSVEDVTLLCLQMRVFGFVTFESADTVKMILARGNPHFICSARVLVKPYRDKIELMDRKYHEKLESMTQYSPHNLDLEDELSSLPIGYKTTRFLWKQLMEGQEDLALEIEGSRLEQLQIARKQMADGQPKRSRSAPPSIR